VGLGEGGQPPQVGQMPAQAPVQRRAAPRLRERRRRERLIGPLHGRQQLSLVVSEDDRLFFPPRHRHVEAPLVRRREGLAGKPDKDFMDGFSLRRVACHGITMVDVPEIPGNHPALIDDGIALLRETLHGKERPVGQPVPAVLGRAIGGDPDAVAGSQRQLRRAIDLETFRIPHRRLAALGDHQPRAALMAGRRRVELEHIARFNIDRIRLLGLGQLCRHPGGERPLLAERAFGLQRVADVFGNALLFGVRRAHHQRRLVLALPVLLLDRRQVAFRQHHVTAGMRDLLNPVQLVQLSEAPGGLAVRERLGRLAVVALLADDLRHLGHP